MSSQPEPLSARAVSPYSGLLSGFAFLLIAAMRLLALLLHAVLATLGPFVRLGLSLLALGGFVTCLIYRFLLHDPHFPLWTMLIFSLSMCALSAGYAAVLRWLSWDGRA